MSYLRIFFRRIIVIIQSTNSPANTTSSLPHFDIYQYEVVSERKTKHQIRERNGTWCHCNWTYRRFRLNLSQKTEYIECAQHLSNSQFSDEREAVKLRKVDMWKSPVDMATNLSSHIFAIVNCTDQAEICRFRRLTITNTI